ncbi:MAG TPA: SDR family oxidoreductase [Alphaproteobacteria bacterium]|nr:SDR family oxidoreductase [Alphaproteobacteria bacterium]
MIRDLDLSGRRVVITGAGRGLGRALAINMAARGADPVLLARDAAALQGVAAAIKSHCGKDAATLPCDLARPESVRAACAAVLAANPVVDVLINNGCPWMSGALAGQSADAIVETVSAGVTGTILMTQGLLPGLRRSAAADIVTIVSTAGWPGWDFGAASAAFHAAKHGQSGFSDTLRRELQPEGIRATAIYPPDFDDVDPLLPDWDRKDRRLGNREVVETVLFAVAAPRSCAYPVIILDHARAR